MSIETPPPVEPPDAPTAPPMPAEPPAVAPKKRPSPLLAGLLGLAIGAGAVGGVWAYTARDTTPPKPDTFTLKGTFTLMENATEDEETGCYGTGGYDDIKEGASVTVYDGAGGIAATGSLGHSEYIAGLCMYDIAVKDVPADQKFYQVEVSHRGKVHLTVKQAKAGELTASLG
ncbi:hypothetical protein [Streptomyces griseus]|uniref:hypothetical protein n=1 Tax=Streptomyces griseus TaxID=1911 RepID=UPI003660D6D8